MDEKLYSLIEMLYIEVQEMKGGMATKEDLKGMATKDDIKGVRQDLVLLEDKMDKNHKALYDGYKLTYEKLGILEEKVDRIEKNVEEHDVEIRVIKGGKIS